MSTADGVRRRSLGERRAVNAPAQWRGRRATRTGRRAQRAATAPRAAAVAQQCSLLHRSTHAPHHTRTKAAYTIRTCTVTRCTMPSCSQHASAHVAAPKSSPSGSWSRRAKASIASTDDTVDTSSRGCQSQSHATLYTLCGESLMHQNGFNFQG